MKEIFDAAMHPLVLPVAFALLLGALAYVLSRWSPFVCKVLAAVAGAGVLAGGILICAQAPGGLAKPWIMQIADVTLIEEMNVSLPVTLAATTLGMVVLIAAAAFAVLITVYSFRAMAGEYWEGKFYAYLLWALGGTCIVALAGNLLVLVVGWEIVTLMLFLMVNQGGRDARTGAAKAYGMLGFADACLLLAVALLAAMDGGSNNWSLTRGAVSVATMGATGYVVYALILIAALAKAGAIPLHTWLPAIAKDAPTPVMAYLPAALDKLLGIYLLARITLHTFQMTPAMNTVLMALGSLTIVAAVMMALVQHDLKRLLG
ncbi:MAG TPA: proton-conducting transporter membrane subunit, partial [Phycisphaerae bacterium]|nr:proton-conducting transporter membrane subunit [Phycisphaerae bacterium]